MPSIVSGIYSGTAMLNRLLERKGRRVGLIVTAGMEDALRLERGIQTYLGYSVLGPPARRHAPPQRAARPARADAGACAGASTCSATRRSRSTRTRRARRSRSSPTPASRAIVVNLLYSYRNGVARGSASRRSRPRSRRTCRCSAPPSSTRCDATSRGSNSTLIEAYAAEPSREQLAKVRDATRDAGAQFDLRIMAAHGGTISIEAKELARTLISGPIGGVIGARYLADQSRSATAPGPRLANIVCTDIGGTSFDIALITDGEFDDQADARHRPLPAQPAAGAGRLDRRRHRLVRAHRPELRAARARARLGRARASASAGRRAVSRRRRSPTSTSCSAASTPTTSSAAT